MHHQITRWLTARAAATPIVVLRDSYFTNSPAVPILQLPDFPHAFCLSMLKWLRSPTWKDLIYIYNQVQVHRSVDLRIYEKCTVRGPKHTEKACSSNLNMCTATLCFSNKWWPSNCVRESGVLYVEQGNEGSLAPTLHQEEPPQPADSHQTCESHSNLSKLFHQHMVSGVVMLKG